MCCSRAVPFGRPWTPSPISAGREPCACAYWSIAAYVNFPFKPTTSESSFRLRRWSASKSTCARSLTTRIALSSANRHDPGPPPPRPRRRATSRHRRGDGARARALKHGVAESSVRLKGKVVLGMFFEASTRTATSFAQAAVKLGAAWHDFRPESSSLGKGETLEDTMRTIQAIGADAIVVRHKESGFPHALARHFRGSILNAGDGWHAHPTQGLLDAMTLVEEFGSLEGRHLVISG